MEDKKETKVINLQEWVAKKEREGIYKKILERGENPKDKK
jgi:hypothetical protein